MTADALTGEIRLGRSWYLAAGFVGAGTAAGLLAMLYLPHLVAGTIIAFLTWETYRAVRLHALRSRDQAISAIRWQGGTLELRTVKSDWQAAECLAGGLVTPWLTVIRLSVLEGARENLALVLAPDALDAESFRRLRARVRWLKPETYGDGM